MRPTLHRPFRRFPLQRTALTLALVVSLTGCDIFGKEDASELDDQLAVVLDEASNGKGADFFRMPDSDDFAAIPQDPRNPLNAAKVELGAMLYHEPALNVNAVKDIGMGTASCASCHHAAAGFQAGVQQGIGEGGWGFGTRGEARVAHSEYDPTELDVQPIRTPSAMNAQYQRVTLWNGQFGGGAGPNIGTEASWTVDTPKETNHLGYEGLETQAIAGLKVHRMADVDKSSVYEDEEYMRLFAEAFGDETFDRERAGLAIAAYERTLLANEAPFQQWLRGKTNAMSETEKRGALVFFGKAQCATCHTGPTLNTEAFYALGMPDLEGPGVVLNGPAESDGRGGFTGDPSEKYAFKVPQLYNLTDSPFLGHGGTFNSVREVIEYKNRAVPAKSEVEHYLPESFKPLQLSEREIADLTAFVENALYDPNLARYVPAGVRSGGCFPVNDEQARLDLGC